MQPSHDSVAIGLRYGNVLDTLDAEFEEETERQGKELAKADKLTDQIVDLLLNAEDALLKFEDDYDTAVSLNKEIREMIYKVENLGCDLRQLAEKVGRG